MRTSNVRDESRRGVGRRKREERRVRRAVKRALITATHELTRFTLDFYGGRLDYLPASRLAEERKLTVAKYRMAQVNYAAVFGTEVLS